MSFHGVKNCNDSDVAEVLFPGLKLTHQADVSELVSSGEWYLVCVRWKVVILTMWDDHHRTERCACRISILKDKLEVEDIHASIVLNSDTKNVHLNEFIEHHLTQVDLMLVEGLRKQICEALTKVVVVEGKCPTEVVVAVEL